MAYIVQRCAEDFNLPSYWRISGISEITLSALRTGNGNRRSFRLVRLDRQDDSA